MVEPRKMRSRPLLSRANSDRLMLPTSFMGDKRKRPSRSKSSIAAFTPMTKDGCFKTSRSTGAQKKVRFNEITIREHPVVLGDNPSVTDGAPITIDWKAQKQVKFDIDLYESSRLKKKRSKKMQLSVEVRTKLLLRSGHSLSEIAQAIVQVREQKILRSESLNKQNWERINIMIESTGKTLRKFVKPGQTPAIARTA